VFQMSPRSSPRTLVTLAVVGAMVFARPAAAQRPLAPAARDSAAAAVLAVVDSALAVINIGDRIALSDLMTPDGQVFAARERDGGGVYTMRTVAEQRAGGRRAPIIERGFDPEVRIAGTIAMVWLPYDLYAEGRWAHCGVDLFTLVRVGSVWRIANFTYSIEQPPACAEHPDGVPSGMLPRGAVPR
jgi:hypothetical protein